MTDKTQPEALRLADELAQRWGENMACPELEAAAELRRLHAENERLSGLCDKWNSECDEFREDNKRLAALVEAQQHTRIAELEAARFAYASEFDPNGDGYPDVGSIHANIRAMKAKLASIGAVGVQAFSAAPAVDIATVGEAQAFEAWYKQDCVIEGAAAKMAAKAAWKARAMLAASPTPPAEQQAAPKAAPESFLDGADVQDESGVLAYYSREAVLACITAALESVAAPKAALGEQFDSEGFRAWVRKNLPDDTIIGSSAWWADHLTTWAQRFVKAAPQQEAQEPALFVSAKQLADLVDPSHATGGSYLPARKTRAGLFTQPLYTTPQPAPAPLTLQQIAKAFAEAGLDPDDYPDDVMIEPLVRTIERAHGITQKVGS